MRYDMCESTALMSSRWHRIVYVRVLVHIEYCIPRHARVPQVIFSFAKQMWIFLNRFIRFRHRTAERTAFILATATSTKDIILIDFKERMFNVNKFGLCKHLLVAEKIMRNIYFNTYSVRTVHWFLMRGTRSEFHQNRMRTSVARVNCTQAI